MNDDGSMARRPELEAFAEQHGLSIGTIADLIQYRAITETTVEMVREEAVETEFGAFRLRMFQDQILGGTHLCLIKGEPTPERPCLVRVHVPDTLRDLVQVSWHGRGSWPLPQALKSVAEAGEGVVVILENRGDEPIEERFSQYIGHTLPKPGTRLVPYLTVGTGSQILKHANVGKMRLLSTPMKFSAISGFDLEVVEYVEYEG